MTDLCANVLKNVPIVWSTPCTKDLALILYLSNHRAARYSKIYKQTYGHKNKSWCGPVSPSVVVQGGDGGCMVPESGHARDLHRNSQTAKVPVPRSALSLQAALTEGLLKGPGHHGVVGKASCPGDGHCPRWLRQAFDKLSNETGLIL